ncbi:MAG: hypothetical protein CR982_04545 [Candidatus Cloacimonadota bacterium]|nr:MAG: hypothetical protein CR982_04545 [Candidatus Cloacimonadota bacterium]
MIILTIFIYTLFLKGEAQPFNLKLEKNSFDFNYIPTLTLFPIAGNISYNRIFYTDLDYFLEASIGCEAIFGCCFAISHGVTLNYGSNGSNYLLLGLNGKYVDGSEIEKGGAPKFYKGYIPPILPLVGWKYVINDRFSFKLWGNMATNIDFSVSGAIFYIGLNYRF